MTSKSEPRKRPAYGLPASQNAVLATATDFHKHLDLAIRPDGSLTPEGIRALLKLRRVNIRALAGTNGYSDAYFYQVIERIRRDRTVEDVIAEAIGIPSDRLWARRSEQECA